MHKTEISANRSELIQGSVGLFFLKKGKVENGVFQVSKFRNTNGWVMRCII